MYRRSPWLNPHILLAASLLFPLLSGCVTELAQVKVEPRPTEQAETPRATEPTVAPPQEVTASPPAAAEKKPLSYRPAPESPAPTQPLTATPRPAAAPKAPKERVPLPATPQEKTDQELLDSAIEFLQAASDFWEQGDLENALDALDQAYLLTLQVDPEKDPRILQQREDLRFTIAKRIIEIYSSRFTAVNGNRKAIPLVMNEHVERAINVFKGGERSFFLNSYRRSGRYRPAILRALSEAGLPEELSWLPLIESGFKVQALSRARALGMWQFIATTGYKYGLKRDQWVDERMDPEKSTAAAIGYLKELHQIFGDWTTALASYNCGEGAVLRSIRTQRINYLDNFWDLYTKLPSETAFYVPRFLAVLHILQNPEAHGLDLPPVEDELQADKVVIERAVHLQAVAQQIGVSYEELKDLNPELRHHATPGRSYALRVPPGKGDLLLARINSVPVWRPPVASYAVHRVRCRRNAFRPREPLSHLGPGDHGIEPPQERPLHPLRMETEDPGSRGRGG